MTRVPRQPGKDCLTRMSNKQIVALLAKLPPGVIN